MYENKNVIQMFERYVIVDVWSTSQMVKCPQNKNICSKRPANKEMKRAGMHEVHKAQTM